MENKIIDIFDDINLKSTLVKIASSLPEDVKRSDLMSVEEKNNLDDFSFALSYITKTAKINKFPIDSRASTAISNSYFDLNHHKIPEGAQKVAATNLLKACKKYNVQPSESVKIASHGMDEHTLNIYVEKMNDKPGKSLKKESSINEDNYFYALVKSAGDKTISRCYAMPDESYLRKAEHYFEKNAKFLSSDDRHTFAHNVVKRAEYLGVPVKSPLVEKYAGEYYSSDLNDHISVRSKLLDDMPVYKDALSKLASLKHTVTPDVFAKALHKFDKMAGLNKYYDKYISDAFKATLSTGKIKTASSTIYSQDGLTLTSDDLKILVENRYDLIKKYFGSSLADGLKSDLESAFVALPSDAKEVIARMANGEII